MKLFQKVAICVIAVVASLFVLAGCEGAGGGNTNTSEGDAYVDNGEDTSGVLTTGLVVATAPNEFVGDFSFDGEVVCTNVSTCEFEATGVVEIEFTSKDKLFLTKYATANPDKDQEVYWDKPGDWGLAPQGMYSDESDNENHNVETKIIDGVIKLIIYGVDDVGTPIKGNKIAYDGPDGTVNGTISSDLKTISQSVYVVSLNETYTQTFTRVE